MNFVDLKKPFAPSKISWRLGATNGDKTKGMALGYIDARDVMDRLDEVCGLDWQCEYVSMHNGTCCCRIGIKIGSEWVWRSNGAINLSDSDKADAKEMAEKGSYSDSFKRAAVLWGIGRYLYDLDSPWVAIEAAGRSFKIAAHEYKRLEALLAKGAGQPTTAPTKPQEAKKPVPVTETPATTITPAAWLQECLDRVPKMDRPALDAFSEKHGDRLARVRTLHPDLHASVIKAIGKRQEELF